MSGYKQIITIIVVISIIIISDFILENYTKKSVDNMIKKLNEIDVAVENEDKIANEKSKELLDEWNEKEKFFNCYIEHNEIEKISDKMNLIKKQVKIESFQDARQSITETEYMLKHIKSKQEINIENLF